MTISEEDTNNIQKKASSKFLQCSEIAKTFPRAVIYGPPSFGGMGLHDLYTDGSCIKIDCILNSYRTSSELSVVMTVVLNWLQLNTGTSIPILESNLRLEYIPMNWFLSVKEFINKIGATIKIPNLWTPSLFRKNDIILMDVVDGLDITTTKKRVFNNFRLFYRINNLSELTNSQGTHIEKRFLTKYGLDSYKPTSTQNWPNQKAPDKKYFTIWINILRAITGIDSTGKLKKPLGAWITSTIHNVPSNVKFLIHKGNQTLIVRDEQTNLWSAHPISHSMRSTYFFHRDTSMEMPIINEQEYDQTDANIHENYYQVNKRNIKSTNYIQQRNRTITQDESLEEFISSPKQWHSKLTKNVTIFDEEEVLQSNRIVISTDGGVATGKGSFGVVMSIEEKVVVENYSRIPEAYNEMHSYRSKGMGILCGLTIYKEIIQYALLKYKTVNNRQIRIESDSQSMVDKVKKLKGRKLSQKDHNDKDMDVIAEILQLLKDISRHNTTIELKFVKGHQDQNNSTNLNTSAKMNIRADQLATKALTQRDIKQNISFPSKKAQIYLHNKPIISNRTQVLQKAHLSINLREYMKSSNNWSEKQIEQIWWKPAEKILTNMTKGKQVIIQKYIHSQLPVNLKTNTMFEYKPPHCTLCSQVTEDQCHMIRCKNSPKRNELREKFKTDIRNYLQSTHTHETTT
jgi:ribonuclease HI